MKIVKIASICAMLILIILGCVSFININNKYPQRKLNEYDVGETLEYEGYSFCIGNAELYEYYDFKDEYNYKDVSGIEVYLEENDTHIVVIDLKVKNTSSDTQSIPPIYYFTLQSVPGAYSTCFNLDVMRYLYTDDLAFLEETIEPDEEINILLPFTVDAAYLPFYDGITLSIEDFMYVISIYPEKNCLLLG